MRNLRPVLLTLLRRTQRRTYLSEVVQHESGDSWGVYLSSRESFDVVRHQLRRFLMT